MCLDLVCAGNLLLCCIVLVLPHKLLAVYISIFCTTCILDNVFGFKKNLIKGEYGKWWDSPQKKKKTLVGTQGLTCQNTGCRLYFYLCQNRCFKGALWLWCTIFLDMIVLSSVSHYKYGALSYVLWIKKCEELKMYSFRFFSSPSLPFLLLHILFNF